jgi:hypothetical protein
MGDMVGLRTSLDGFLFDPVLLGYEWFILFDCGEEKSPFPLHMLIYVVQSSVAEQCDSAFLSSEVIEH